MGDTTGQPDERLAERVRDACLRAARAAWDDARLAGLCADGAWEVAVGAVRSLDLSALRADPAPGESGDPSS